MGNDQRHKMRLYASWLLPVSETLGQMTVGVIQRADTGLPYDIAFTVNPTAYLTNPGYVTAPTSLTYYIDNRGPLRTGNVYATDLSFVWTKKLKGSFEVFFRGLVYNIFNNQAVAGSGSVDTTVSSNASPGSYTAASLPAFNSYTTAPVYDVNYRYGPNFGKPTAPSSYQVPRSANFSVGVRF
jgi:hypothetical protein